MVFMTNNAYELSEAIQGVRDPNTVMQHRDASNKPNNRWKNPPTPIMAPSNTNRNHNHDPSGGNFISATLTKSRNPSSRVGNPTASSVLVTRQRPITADPPAHPRKKQRLSEPGEVVGSSTGSRSQGYGRRKLEVPPVPRLAPESETGDDHPKVSKSSETIIIDDEDIGEPLTRDQDVSSDELNITTRTETTHSEFSSNPHRKTVPRTLKNVLSSKHFDVAPDGDATRRIRMKVRPEVINIAEEDPIEDFPSTPQSTPKQTGNVKRAVEAIEAKNPQNKMSSNAPHLDLQKQSRIKQQMKPKSGRVSGGQAQLQVQYTNLLSSTQHQLEVDPIATAPTLYKRNTNTLPLDSWFLGLSPFKKEDNLNGCVEWNNSDVTINTEPEYRAIKLKTTGRSIEDFQCVIPGDGDCFVVMVAPKRTPVQSSAGFTTGAEGLAGSICLKFDTSSPEWQPERYKVLIDKLKKASVGTQEVRPKDAMSFWQHQCLARTPQPVSSSAGIPDRYQKRSLSAENDFVVPIVTQPEPPNPKPPSTRPRPRPINKGRTSDTNGTSSALPDEPPPPPRRSARQSIQQQKDPPPPADSDEVILVYPQGSPGAVNITNADVRRLEPGEFLNDSLIEFGLKMWLKDMDPELAKQFHVFSSFFYKKLNKQTFDEGFDSVKKWTAKFNLFEKKYILVPINENAHWYLVIIHNPEYVLLPPSLAPSPSTRRRVHETGAALAKPLRTSSRRKSTKTEDDAKVEAVAADIPAAVDVGQTEHPVDPPPKANSVEPFIQDTRLTASTVAAYQDRQEDTSSDQEVERKLLTFDSACSISVQPSQDDDEPMDVDTEGIDTRMRSPSVSEWRARGDNTSELPSHDRLAADEEEDTNVRAEKDGPTPVSPLFTTVDPVDFYAEPSKAKGKAKEHSSEKGSEGLVEATDEHDEPVEFRPMTYIFTLDSLGSAHPKVIKYLRRYLIAEAKDKLGITKTSEAKAHQAHVPFQPNYCDCGIYLLHFARLYTRNPKHCLNIMLSQKAAADDRQQTWMDAEVAKLREELKEEINRLSKKWKAEREVDLKETAKGESSGVVEVESSGDEIDIVETGPSPSSTRKGKGKGKGKAGKVTAIEKPASRIR